MTYEMISGEQEQQITDYLMLYKLPLDILLEVKDHMTSQITDIQLERDLEFDQAFHEAKKLWESDFKMTQYPFFYNEQIPVIVKEITRSKHHAILKKSLLLVLISFAVNMLSVYLSADQEVYTALFRLQNSLFILVPLGIWIFDSDMRRYLKGNFKYRGKLFYTMHQRNPGLLIVSINAMFQIVLKKGTYPFEYFRTADSVSLFPVILMLIIPLVLQMTVLFVMINFFEHKKALARIQGFLRTSGE